MKEKALEKASVAHGVFDSQPSRQALFEFLWSVVEAAQKRARLRKFDRASILGVADYIRERPYGMLVVTSTTPNEVLNNIWTSRSAWDRGIPASLLSVAWRWLNGRFHVAVDAARANLTLRRVDKGKKRDFVLTIAGSVHKGGRMWALLPSSARLKDKLEFPNGSVLYGSECKDEKCKDELLIVKVISKVTDNGETLQRINTRRIIGALIKCGISREVAEKGVNYLLEHSPSFRKYAASAIWWYPTNMVMGVIPEYDTVIFRFGDVFHDPSAFEGRTVLCSPVGYLKARKTLHILEKFLDQQELVVHAGGDRSLRELPLYHHAKLEVLKQSAGVFLKEVLNMDRKIVEKALKGELPREEFLAELKKCMTAYNLAGLALGTVQVPVKQGKKRRK